MINCVNQIGQPNVALPGAYAQVGWFLTGEHRPYDRACGAIDRVKPFANFFFVNTSDGRAFGSGAWEIAARISYLNLNDENVRGGELTDFTAGLNWYWNPYTKVVFNYIHAWNDAETIDPATGRPIGNNNTDIYAGRVQMDF
jgi:phosphate-selective porin OprO/OprP